MERCSAVLLASSLIACAPMSFAASSTDLSVTGIITPSACAPTLSNGGIVDHGKLTAKDLDHQLPTRLPAGEMQLEVHCEAATFFTLTTLDNRAGTSAIKPEYHGLGVVNDDQNLGSVAFGVFEPQADGNSVLTIMSRDGGVSWAPSSYLGHAGLTSFAAPGDPHTPIAIKDLNARMRAFTIIAPASDLTLLDELPIDGHATMQLKYL
ncbi:DUF1120 domain-containing protein [Pseudomonas sp. C1C7]|uniref:DUF1120 domain-containing protein n=1 Tax=Pseudomonas sp. C1C7 TaxID=2735272 RepID=UPI0015862456|nr:DUF1120 domain-containing protein [Pseudomonas sp. C1C7]NUT76536.1 DUF1120 domain-containing protein [Pseudomonas sp. C1C7]